MPLSTPITRAEIARTARTLDTLPQLREQAGAPPFARILLATDGETTSAAATEWARVLAPGARTWILHVVPTLAVRAWGVVAAGPPPLGEAIETGSEARVCLADAQATVRPVGGDALVAYGDPAQEILDLADSIKADLIIVGTHGRRGARLALLGSVADAVRHKTRTSLLVARAPPGAGPVLAPIDGSANATRAAGLAATVAARLRLDLTLLHVKPRSRAGDLAPLDVTHAPGQLTEVVLEGDASERIIETASVEQASLIVMGARGLGRVRSLVMGSVSTRVCHDASTSVLVVRP